jgi:hypothetical protein
MFIKLDMHVFLIMGERIYGVDLSEKITPVMVRDAIIRCFVKAHAEVLEQLKQTENFESNEEFQQAKNLHIERLIQEMFNEVGDSFENPSKQGILQVIEKLKQFATVFRNPEIIQKHAGEIVRLVEKLE